MDNNLLTVIVSLIGTIFGSIIGALSASRVVDYRLNILEDKVDKFSSLLERMALAELKIETIDNYVRDNCE